MGSLVSAVIIDNLYIEVFEEQAIEPASYKPKIWNHVITRNSSHFLHAILLCQRFIENLQRMLSGIGFPKQHGAIVGEM